MTEESLQDKKRARLPAMQIFFVLLSFSIMVISSYIFTNINERANLEEQIENTFINIEHLLESELSEFESTLGFISETIRNMFGEGYTDEAIMQYVQRMTMYGIDDKQIPGFLTLFIGFTDDEEVTHVFNGLHPQWSFSEAVAAGEFDPVQRLWYKAADTSRARNGEIVVTDPYQDFLNGENAIVFTYVRNLYDADGKRIAIVCMDVLLNRLYEFSLQNRGDESNVWTLHDKNHITIAHPNNDFVGLHFSTIDSPLVVYAGQLERDGYLSNISSVDYIGRQVLFSMRQLSNGWFLGVLTYTDDYYSTIREMLFFFIVLGAILASGLIAILIRINLARFRSEQEMQRLDKEKNALVNLNNILNGIASMILVTDPETDEILFMNNEMRKEFGVDYDCTGHLCYRVLRGFDKRCEYCPCYKLSEDPDREVVWEQPHVPSGRIYRSFSRYTSWPNGQTVHILYSMDITDIIEYENELAEKNELNQILFTNAPIGLTVYDSEFRFVDCNENVLKMFGMSRLEYAKIFGTPEHSPEFQPDGSNSHEKALNVVGRVMSGERVQIEWVHRRADGELLPVELTMTRIRRGNDYLGLGYIYDMREQNKLKEEVEAALYKAESASRAKSSFLANMSHEIRTPMNAILGITEIQLRDESLPEHMEKSLEKVYDSGTLLLNIINDILDLSKIEAGKMEIIPVKYNFPSFINDTVQINRLRYESKPISFILEADENIPLSICGDELRLKQVLSNLISNAFKYTEEGEIKLTVTAEAKQGDDITLTFKISDTGQGMTREQLDALYDEYTRFNMDANRTTVGTGLGMSITKHLIELMGGTIEVDSEIHKGTTFTVKVAQKRIGDEVCGSKIAKKLQDFTYQGTSISKRSRILREPMPYGSILIVDDVESNIYVTKGMLLPYSLKIDTAGSGFEAVKKIENGNVYDIIFMDHMMPKMDGIETTRLIRELGYTHPIIALTANALIGQAEIFLKNGFNGYISKPIDSRELHFILNDFIRDKQSTEVVEKAHRESKEKRAEDMSKIKSNQIDIEKFFIMDAQSAISTFEEICAKGELIDDTDIETYEITAHGMKSAMKNIGEDGLSAVAAHLEQLAKDADVASIRKSTPSFIDQIRVVTDRLSAKFTTEETSGRMADTKAAAGSTAAEYRVDLSEIHEDDLSYLCNSLLCVKKFCEASDAEHARSALRELLKRDWNRDISDMLDDINVKLLHGLFDDAAALTDAAVEALK